jgi:hypothetical protein
MGSGAAALVDCSLTRGDEETGGELGGVEPLEEELSEEAGEVSVSRRVFLLDFGKLVPCCSDGANLLRVVDLLLWCEKLSWPWRNFDAEERTLQRVELEDD